MFIVLEVQTNKNGETATLVTSFSNKEQAESKYHSVLSAAAISDIAFHTAFLLTADGFVLNSECYEHPTEATE